MPVTTKYICFLFLSVGLVSAHAYAQDSNPVSKDALPEPAVSQEKESGDVHEQAVRITKLIPALESKEAVIREQAFSQLLEIGLPVIPFMIDYLKDKSVYVDLTRRIMERAGFTSDFIEKELKSLKHIPAVSMTNLDRQVIEKYFYGRYLDALRLCQQERYDEARSLVRAVLMMDNRLKVHEQLQLLLISIEERVIQKNILMANLTSSRQKNIYEIGDTAELVFRLQNVSRSPVQIDLGSNPAVLYIAMTVHSTTGDYNSITRMQDVKLGVDGIELKPGEKKEFPVTIVTKGDMPESIYYRTYNVYLGIKPKMIKSEALADHLDKQETLRQIVTPEILLRYFPPDVGPALEKPMVFLEQALKGELPLDIFLCAQLVDEKDADKAIKMLFEYLDKFKDNNLKQTVLNCIRSLTNLPFELDETTWREWYKNKYQSR
ncbi:MAG: hypothetical protein WC980_00015 [Candidatus Brocadiia bacterium]